MRQVLGALGLAMTLAAVATGSANARSSHARFTLYPAFGDRLGPGFGEDVEVITSKGLLVELHVRCGTGIAVMTFSEVERLYCSPIGRCDRDLDVARHEACR